MRVLFLTTEFPWPITSGGRVRSASEIELVCSLPEVDAVTLFTICETPIAESVTAEVARAQPKLRIVPPPFHPVHLREHKAWIPWVAALRLVARLPYLAGKWVSPRVAWELRGVLERGSFDVVYVDHVGMAAYLPLIRWYAPRARLVLEQHNVESDFFAQFRDRKRGLVRQIAASEYKEARRFEQASVQSVDAVVAISDDDARTFERMGAKDAVVVPQVITFQKRARTRPPDANKARLVYLGNLSWHPNVEGLDWFFAEVWPHVRRALPECTFDIGGSGLKRDAQGQPMAPAAWRRDGVDVVGFVDDPNVFYEGASCFVAPIIGGSGVRIKLLEAFRAGLPLVTTTDGAKGLPLRDGEHGVIASEPEAFAKGIARVASSDSLWQTFVERGYAYLEGCHSPEVARAVMRRALASTGAPSPRAT